MRWIVIFIYVVCFLYVQYRGKVRHRFFRQLSDHSTLTAPFACFSYLFSTVPIAPFIDEKLFPELDVLKREWKSIANEALLLRDAGKIRSSDKYDDIGFNSFFRGGWQRFYLKWYGKPHPSALAYCPQTIAILEKIPSIKAAMFAELPPDGKLGLHRDPSCGVLRYHLGLVTPNDDKCWISVDGQRYSWRDGEAVVFDETYLHTARNETGKDRIILFCDIERPMRYRWAQWVNGVIGFCLMRGAVSPNESGDRTGGLNRIFKYLYAIRRVGKRLKAWNKTIYYIVKWCLFGGIVLAIFWR